MAITIIQERKKQRYLMLGAALIVFIAIFIVWQGVFPGQKIETEPLAPSAVYIFPAIDIDLEFLDNFGVRPLQPFKEISEFQGKFGRTNPFIPY